MQHNRTKYKQKKPGANGSNQSMWSKYINGISQEQKGMQNNRSGTLSEQEMETAECTRKGYAKHRRELGGYPKVRLCGNAYELTVHKINKTK